MAKLYKHGYKPAKLCITLPNEDKTWLLPASEDVKFVQDLNTDP